MDNGIVISRELLDEIITKTVKSYIVEEKKDKKRKRTESINNTKKQLKAYRRIKKRLEEEQIFTEDEKADYRWKFVEDLVGNAKEIVSKSERIIKDEEKKRQEDIYAMYRIESAMKLYKNECDMSSSNEEKRRYREIYDLYIANERKSVSEIAENEKVSEKTVYRDVGIACRILSIYLYGI